MRRKAWLVVAAAALAAVSMALAGAAGGKKADWSVRATIIEGCSCPMFCQCFFNDEPAGHGGSGHRHGEQEHFCRFNMGVRIDEGHYGDTKLDGSLFWVAGDLGDNFADGKMEWAVLTFDKRTTPEQRRGIEAFIGTVYPVEWADRKTAEGQITWKADRDVAHATLDGGRTAEVKLAGNVNAARPGKPVVIENLKYWNAKRNDGFVLMPNEVEAWREGERAFEYKGTSGWMITIEADSEWAAKKAR